jgi:hypothetical protein
MTRFQVKLTHHAFRQIVENLKAQPERLMDCPAGLSLLADQAEWLVHNLTRRFSQDDSTAPGIVVVGGPDPSYLRTAIQRAMDRPSTRPMEAFLGLGPAAGTALAAGCCRTSDGIHALDALYIVGPGMPSFSLRIETERPAPDWVRNETWSRTIGALGEQTWQRLCSAQIALIGCGRSGSLVAFALDSLGVKRLTLIDPDRVETHNVGEMAGVASQDVEKPKVRALAASIGQDHAGYPQIKKVAESILSLSALVAAKPADVLVSCVDNAAARFASAFLATLYAKPLLDIGTGILRPEMPRQNQDRSGTRRMGADVRLVLPGRCLFCLGNVGDLARSRHELLASTSLQHHEPGSQHWHEERLGSLRSLNGVAVHLGIRLLEDLYAGHVRESTWIHLEFDQHGIPHLEHRQPSAQAGCHLCELTARGDEGVSLLPGLLSNLTEPSRSSYAALAWQP